MILADLHLSLQLRCVLRRSCFSVLLDCEQQRLEARRCVHPIEQGPNSEGKVETFAFKTCNYRFITPILLGDSMLTHATHACTFHDERRKIVASKGL